MWRGKCTLPKLWPDSLADVPRSNLMATEHREEGGGEGTIEFLPTRLPCVRNTKSRSTSDETALEAWNERCEQIAQSYLSGKDVGDELLRLQAARRRTR